MHMWIVKFYFIFLHLGIESGGKGKYAILQLVGDYPQQVAATI